MHILWLEYIVATNEWYVKPTADKGKAEGWMCLASDPPTRPELSRGTCEVWDGDRWTLQSCVTVMTAACAFSIFSLRAICIAWYITAHFKPFPDKVNIGRI